MGVSGSMRRWRAVVARVAVLLCGCALSWSASAASAFLERNPIRADETVRLVIEVDGGAQSTANPDLRPLTSDFSVLGTSTNTQITVEGGQQVARTQWIVELAPRRVGTLKVPPIAVSGTTTPALELEVLSARSQAGAGPPREIFLETEAAPETPYVQAQVVFTVRLFLGIDVLEGSLSEPRADGALVERLGSDASFEAMRGGRRYRVVERRYVVFPQASGKLELSPVRFEGRVADGSSGLSSLFDRGRRVRARSAPMALDVQPRPQAFTGPHWLPASELELREQWPSARPDFRVGEPLTRTVTLQAAGLSGVQLPEIAVPEVPGMRAYPDQAETLTRQGGAGVLGTRTERVALVPSVVGTVTLPAIEVRWWDVEEDREKTARLPERTVSVAPAAGAGEAAAVATAPTAGAEMAAREDAGEPFAGAAGQALWPAVSVGLLIGWLTTLAAWWWRSRRQAAVRAPAVVLPSPAVGRARDRLRRACAQNDAATAGAALLDVAAALWPQAAPRSLPALARRLDGALAAEVLRLDRVLWGGDEERWSADVLWPLAKQLSSRARATASQARREPLPPLRPEGA